MDDRDSSARRALLERLRRGDAGDGPAAPEPIRPRPDLSRHPLSVAQERIWALEQLAPGVPLHNLTSAVRIRGLLDPGLLGQALRDVAQRHEVLRARFPRGDAGPVQLIAPEPDLQLPVVDLGRVAGQRREEEAGRAAQEESRRPFDLARGPLLRASLLRLDDREHVLLTGMHHIVTDSASAAILGIELWLRYSALLDGARDPFPPLPIQYADYAAWQLERLRGPAIERDLAHWTGTLQGAPMTLEIPGDRPRPPVLGYGGESHPFTLSRQFSDELRRLARREGVSLFMVLLSAFAAVLGRYAGRDDMVLGSPVLGRDRPELGALVGCFINPLALRVDLSGDPSFRELMRRVRGLTLAAYAHQELPFERLVAALQPRRDPSRTSVFQFMFNLRQDEEQPLSRTGAGLEMPG